MSDHLPLILIELVLVFGGVLAFAWWQLRDVKRAQEQAAAAKRAREAQSGNEEP
jgi:predicted negative regulator of RcsB-dependent stress response